MKRTAFCLVLAGLVCGIADAQEWKLGLGVSYRQFDDVEFSGATLRNFGDLEFILRDGAALDYTPANLGAVIGDLPGGTGAINIVENVVVTSGYLGVDEDTSDSDGWAPVLTGEYLFMTKDRLSLSVVANFMYFNVEVGGMAAMPMSSTAQLNQYFVVAGSVSPLPTGPGTSYNDIMTSGFASNDFSMDLYGLDLGLKLAYSFDLSIDVYAAVGPTLSIVDLDSSVTETASYSAPGNAGGTFYSQALSESATDALFGVYGALGGAAWLNERVGIVLEARYDEVFDTAETDLAELDLSGLSGAAKIIFRF